ncbi:MAG: hypothetical protein ACK481_04950 [Candidatus Melainabacteria bacterium]
MNDLETKRRVIHLIRPTYCLFILYLETEMPLIRGSLRVTEIYLLNLAQTIKSS